jgi:hypothetical protein
MGIAICVVFLAVLPFFLVYVFRVANWFDGWLTQRERDRLGLDDDNWRGDCNE